MVDNSELVIDGKKYLVIDTISSDNGKYIYFTNETDDTDFFVRKEIIDSDERFLIGLTDEQEYIKAMQLFNEKNQ